VTIDGHPETVGLKFRDPEGFFASPTDADKINLHNNNNALMEDAGTGEPLMPDLRGASLTYNVHLIGDQDRGCVSGVYLYKHNDKRCNTVTQTVEEGEGDRDPYCAYIDAFQASIYGFETKVNRCRNGKCDDHPQCILGTQEDMFDEYGADAYGPGGSIIDTYEPFQVKNEFISTPDQASFWKMRTELTQAGRSITLEKDCRDSLGLFDGLLNKKMGIVLSNWHDTTQRESFELGKSQAPAPSCAGATAIFRDFQVNTLSSLEERGPELIYGGPMNNVEDCEVDGCTECRKSWWSNDESNVFPTCTDKTVYKYGQRCNKKGDRSNCGEGDLCWWSWPHDDPKKWNSAQRACRPIPLSYTTGPFKYAKKVQKDHSKGLCILGCDGRECRWSIPKGAKWNDARAMARCVEDD